MDEMDFFNMDGDLELNFDPTPPGLGDDNQDNNNVIIDENGDNNNDNNNINHQGEGQSDQNNDNDDSESVAEGEDNQNEGDEANSGNDSPNLFSSVANVLYDEGVLPSLDIDSASIESAEDLAKTVQAEVQSLYKKAIVDKLGEEGYDYIEKGVDLRDYNEYQDRTNILNSITEDSLIEDIELSKNVVYEDYISKGMSPEKATKLIQRSLELGENIIVEDAKESLANLKQYNKVQIDQKAAKVLADQKAAVKAQADQERKVKNSIYSVNGLENGPSINKATQDKVYKSMTTVVGNSPQGVPENALMRARREDPINFDTKLYYVYELTKGFTDFSKFGKASKNKAISDLERAMQTNKNDHAGTPSFVTDKDSYQGSWDGHQLNF